MEEEKKILPLIFDRKTWGDTGFKAPVRVFFLFFLNSILQTTLIEDGEFFPSSFLLPSLLLLFLSLLLPKQGPRVRKLEVNFEILQLDKAEQKEY